MVKLCKFETKKLSICAQQASAMRVDLYIAEKRDNVFMMVMIAPNCRERKRGKGSMEEFEGRRRGMLTTGDWCDPVSNMLHHV